MRASASADRMDLVDRGTLIWAGVLVAVGLTAAVLFGRSVEVATDAWSVPEYSHGWLIPLVTGFLLWQRRRRIWAARAAGSWAGVGLVALGLLILVLAWLALMQVPQALALVLVLAGLGLASLGWQAMRPAWLPLAFLLFSLPLPGTAYVLLSTNLQLISSQLGAWMLQTLGISVYLQGNVIDLGVYKMQVAEACSGLRYLFPLTAFGFLCAWLYRAPFWVKAVVFLATVPITVLTNSARIALTGVLIEYGSLELAEGFLHLFEGWLIFLVALAFLLALMWGLAKLRDRRARLADLLDFDRTAGGDGPVPASRGETPNRPGTPLLACLALLVAILPVEAAISRRAELIPERPGLVTFPMRLGHWQGRSTAIDDATLASLGADDYLHADYIVPDDATASVNLWVAYYGSQNRSGKIHSPKQCLPGAGWEFAQLRTIPSPAADVAGEYFAINSAIVANGPERMLMYYWYEQRGRHVTDEIQGRISVLHDAFTSRRSDGALVRLLTPLRPGEPEAAAAARLDDFFRVMYPVIEPHVGA